MLTVDELRHSLRQSLKGWRPRMEKAGIATIYGLLSSYSLFPILLAYQHGQYDDSGLMALGALLSSLGINVVSTQSTYQLERWRREIDSEEKLARHIEGLPADSPTSRWRLPTRNGSGEPCASSWNASATSRNTR